MLLRHTAIVCQAISYFVIKLLSETMKSTHSFENKEGYLSLTISGEYDKMDFLAYAKLLKDTCDEERAHKVLVDNLNVIGTNVSTMDRFFLGEQLANVAWGKIKVAVVWPEKDIDKFAENVAINRGAYACVFGDIETAKKWLLDNV